ncbi:MAG: ribosomal RNA small subunit methyltransferase A [Bacilli bacterium]|nr:ribosomal RNA small subunit methyltransferase A [Bacilli bacterium]
MLKPKKKFGQNFLKDDSILNKIVDNVNVNNNEIIIEIGPGKGYLTKYLKKFNKKLYCFEIDKDMKTYLDNYIDDNTMIIYDDFLSINLNDYFKSDDKIHVIANIPYYITTPIIKHLIDSKLNIVDMTLMVQKEVANRLSSTTSSSEYGYITVYLNYYFEINKLFDVDKRCFDPVPNVDSSVIQLKKKNNKLNVENEEIFNKLLKDAFKMKRKNLRNNLRNYDLNKIEAILNKHNLNLTNRAEDLSVDVFVEIANNL